MSTKVEVPVKMRGKRAEFSRPEKSAVQPLTVIRPSTGWKVISLGELWDYRALILNFIWRDVKVRYKHTVLGVGWAVLQPFMMMLVFASYFAIIHPPGENALPYPVFIYSGIMPWIFFSSATIAAGGSIVHSEHLITKIYFPRLVATVASVGVYVVDFVIAFLLFMALMLYFGRTPTWGWLLAPVVLAMFALAALGVGINLAALNVTYRDFRLVVPFMMQLWFFATPIIFLQPVDPALKPHHDEDAAVRYLDNEDHTPYSHESISQQEQKTLARHRVLLLYNPMYSMIITFRAAILGEPAVPWMYLGISLSVFLVLLLVGSVYFHRVEDKFADII
jgi:lipopolysaccharide transport system permease protein